jgi:hypothetical protein
MNQEAIDKLKEFQIKNHLSGYNLQEPQIETNSISEEKPKRAINYPKHIKPLQDRIMSAVTGSGLRTPQAIATYCGEDNIKIVNMQLGRLMNIGKLVRYTNKDSGITRYYTPDEAKAKGYKPDAQPKKVEKRSSSVTAKLSADKQTLRVRINDGKPVPNPFGTLSSKGDYAAFLEKRISEWQAESRKQAHEILELRDALAKARKTRDVTSEVTEVMEEVTKLRATVEYLESKLFGSK